MSKKTCHPNNHVPTCPLCRLYESSPDYRAHVESSNGPVEPVPSIWRPDRCVHLGRQIEFKAKCKSGMGCRHHCEIGLEAVPSKTCQTCSQYSPYPRDIDLYPVPWVGDLTNATIEDVVRPGLGRPDGVLAEGVVVLPALLRERPVGRGNEGLGAVDLEREQERGQSDELDANARQDQDSTTHGDSPSILLYAPEPPPFKKSPMIWQYGLTTIPSRLSDGTAKRTLDSLARAGFDRPHLFVDGGVPDDARGWVGAYDVNQRSCPVRTAGNWVLSLFELWMRDGKADRYALFQDDFVTYPGLREYLDTCSYPEKGYWNLYTFPRNQLLAPKNDAGGTVDGWFLANQLGKGAVALVFDGPAVRTLLGQEYLVDRFLSTETDARSRGGRRCDRSIDGGIVEAMKRKGYQEWCHSPSLVQHTGLVSSMGNHNQQLAESFRGEGWDARTMIKT